jgi:hypothetical protein
VKPVTIIPVNPPAGTPPLPISPAPVKMIPSSGSLKPQGLKIAGVPGTPGALSPGHTPAVPSLPSKVAEQLPVPAAPPQAPAPTPEKTSEVPIAPPPAAPSAIPKPPPIVLHKELIPKEVTIVRMYYSQDVIGPENTLDFDINGSGFTTEFESMIQVECGGLDVNVKNLRLVTANQIHGQIDVGPEALTEYIFPRVLIHNLPVFRAEKPLGVVRPGEVLNMYFIAMGEDGRSGRFRVVTNLDDSMARQFRVKPSTDTLELSPLEAHLPYAMEGVIEIGPGIEEGVFGLTAYMNSREVFSNEQMIHIVHPNLGETGLAEHVTSDQPFRRPGDTVDISLHGTGFTADDARSLKAKVNELNMGNTGFTWKSETEMHGKFKIPSNAPEGNYTVTVSGLTGKALSENKTVFTIVPPNWTDRLELAPKGVPGHTSQLKLYGRDMTPEFAAGLQVEVDDPGLVLTPFKFIDPSTLSADLTIDPKVSAGDYLLHISYQGKPVKPHTGSIIKIQPE